MPANQDTPMEFIAEVGSNFAGDLEIARDYIRRSAAAGATAVKFQTLTREKLIAPYIFSEETWIDNPVYKGFSNVGLPDEWHALLMKDAAAAGIEFFSTPFHLEAVDVMEACGVKTYKIASGDLTFTLSSIASAPRASASSCPPEAARLPTSKRRSQRYATPVRATSRCCTASSAIRPRGRR